MKPTKGGDSTRAIRTMETTGPAPGLSLEVRYTRDEIDELVKAIPKAKSCNGKTAVICREHEMIPDLLTAFAWKSGPKAWDDDVHDRLGLLDFENGKPTRLRDLPQKLLPGDRDK